MFDNEAVFGACVPKVGAKSAILSVADDSFAVSFGLAPAVCTSICPSTSLEPRLPFKSWMLNFVPSTCSVAAKRYFGVLGSAKPVK